MKYRRKMIAWLLAGTMTVLLARLRRKRRGKRWTAPRGETARPGKARNPRKPGRLVFANRLASDTFLKLLQDKFVGLCEEDGSFEVVLADANNDSQAQIDQVANFMVQEVDAPGTVPQ